MLEIKSWLGLKRDQYYECKHKQNSSESGNGTNSKYIIKQKIANMKEVYTSILNIKVSIGGVSPPIGNWLLPNKRCTPYRNQREPSKLRRTSDDSYLST